MMRCRCHHHHHHHHHHHSFEDGRPRHHARTVDRPVLVVACTLVTILHHLLPPLDHYLHAPHATTSMPTHVMFEKLSKQASKALTEVSQNFGSKQKMTESPVRPCPSHAPALKSVRRACITGSNADRINVNLDVATAPRCLD